MYVALVLRAINFYLEVIRHYFYLCFENVLQVQHSMTEDEASCLTENVFLLAEYQHVTKTK